MTAIPRSGLFLRGSSGAPPPPLAAATSAKLSVESLFLNSSMYAVSLPPRASPHRSGSTYTARLYCRSRSRNACRAWNAFQTRGATAASGSAASREVAVVPREMVARDKVAAAAAAAAATPATAVRALPSRGGR